MQHFFCTSSVLAPVSIVVIKEDESFPLGHIMCLRILTLRMDVVDAAHPAGSDAAFVSVTFWQRPLSVPHTDRA